MMRLSLIVLLAFVSVCLADPPDNNLRMDEQGLQARATVRHVLLEPVGSDGEGGTNGVDWVALGPFGGDIDEAAGQAVADEAKAAGGTVEFLALDATDHDSIARFAGQVLERAGFVDIVVNAVGGAANEPFMATGPETWARDVALNFLSCVDVSHPFLPQMIAAGRGKIVNVASDAGRAGSTGETVYAGAKGGVIAFTKSLAREVARHKINVNCICPGPTDTPLLRSRPAKMLEALERAIPLRRFARPENEVSPMLPSMETKSMSMISQPSRPNSLR